MSDDDGPYDGVSPQDEALVVLDGTRRPYEWQPTISATAYVDEALRSGPPARHAMIEAYIVAYNAGVRDEKLREL